MTHLVGSAVFVVVIATIIAASGILPSPFAGSSTFPMCSSQKSACSIPSHATIGSGFPVTRTEEEWRTLLTPDQYSVLRQQGTEPAFHNAFWDNHAEGTYVCAGCGQVLFTSSDKFDSNTGWPSFTQSSTPTAIATTVDSSFGMTRTEVHCANCGGHLGHVFPDGPTALGGLRYCINSTSLAFQPAAQE